MVHIKSALMAIVLSMALLASASPFYYPREIKGLPKETSHIALDEKTGKVIAYNEAWKKLGEFSLPKMSVNPAKGQNPGNKASGLSGKGKSNGKGMLPEFTQCSK